MHQEQNHVFLSPIMYAEYIYIVTQTKMRDSYI